MTASEHMCYKNVSVSTLRLDQNIYSNLERFYEYPSHTIFVITILTGQMISAVYGMTNAERQYLHSNSDAVFIHMYVSTSDYDLAVSRIQNEQRHLAYILYGDKFSSEEIEGRDAVVL